MAFPEQEKILLEKRLKNYTEKVERLLERSGLESADIIHRNSFMAASIWDTIWAVFDRTWSCIGRLNLEAAIPTPSSETDAGAIFPICHEKILARAGRTVGHQHKVLSLLIDS